MKTGIHLSTIYFCSKSIFSKAETAAENALVSQIFTLTGFKAMYSQ